MSKLLPPTRLHGHWQCPVWGEAVMPDENGHCSLCGFSINMTLVEIFDEREGDAWRDGFEEAEALGRKGVEL